MKLTNNIFDLSAISEFPPRMVFSIKPLSFILQNSWEYDVTKNITAMRPVMQDFKSK